MKVADKGIVTIVVLRSGDPAHATEGGGVDVLPLLSESHHRAAIGDRIKFRDVVHESTPARDHIRFWLRG